MRFIEWMPLDADQSWRSGAVVSQEEIVAAVGAEFPVEPLVRATKPERFAYRDGNGEIGVIPSVTRPFCGSCDRIRLTADGQLRSCCSRWTRSICGRWSGTASRPVTTWPAVQRCVAGSGPAHDRSGDLRPGPAAANQIGG